MAEENLEHLVPRSRKVRPKNHEDMLKNHRRRHKGVSYWPNLEDFKQNE